MSEGTPGIHRLRRGAHPDPKRTDAPADHRQPKHTPDGLREHGEHEQEAWNRENEAGYGPTEVAQAADCGKRHIDARSGVAVPAITTHPERARRASITRIAT